ncbi:unnamed protein product [Ectocarpus sp. 13 AM-2016]
MVGSAAGSWRGELPVGMRFYSFMFDDQHLLPGYVKAGKLPAPSSLLLGMAMGVVLTGVRLALDMIVFKPLARSILGFPRRQNRAIPAIDHLCTKSNLLSPEEVAQASASSGLSQEEVKAYAKGRRLSALEDKKIDKFKEAAWRLVVYMSLVIYGLRVASGKPWFKDPELVWEDWPLGNGIDGLDQFYHVAMGVYWHFILFQFWDTRRSDFAQMLVHHVATISLLTFSWLLSLVRIGTLIMLCHDVADIFMETAKLFNYSQKRYHWCHLAADGFFFVFAGVFGFSRLYIFPKYLVLSVWRTAVLSEVMRHFFTGQLCTLLVLHVFWFYLIMRMVYMFVFHGVEEDIRSDNEQEEVATANGSEKKAVENGKPPAYDGGRPNAGKKTKTT